MVSDVQETVDITDCPPSSAKKTKKEREKEKAEREKSKVDSDTKSLALSQTQVSTDGVEGSEKIVLPEPTPHIWMSLKENKELSGFEIIKSMKLPSHEEVKYFSFFLC